jgi:hypothetical protein
MCSGNMSLFSRTDICKNCQPHFSEWLQLMNSIGNLRSLQDAEMSRLRVYGKNPLIKLYSKLYGELIKDVELSDEEMLLLDRIQIAFDLSREDIGYTENVLPYYYASCVRKTNQLPPIQFRSDIPIVLKKGEIVHHATTALLKESRVVNLGYQGGSHGVSIRIMKGVSYRVGAHRGHILKEDQLVQTSGGHLLITNQRLFLIPAGVNNKAVTMPVGKITFYRCSENALEVYKEGREKGFFFIMMPGDVEIFGICLGVLLKQEG